jgi:hypothetical protein
MNFAPPRLVDRSVFLTHRDDTIAPIARKCDKVQG